MALTLKTNKKIWLDPKGREIPVDVISQDDRRKDAAVERAFRHVFKVQALMRKVFDTINAILVKYLDSVAAQHDMEWKGNVDLTDYSNTLKARRVVNDQIEFGPKLQLCKQILDEIANDLTADGRSELKVMIQEAYKTDKKGQIDRFLLERLFRHDFSHPRWEEARQLFHESKEVNGTKSYWIFYAKPGRDQDAAFKTVPLNWNQLG